MNLKMPYGISNYEELTMNGFNIGTDIAGNEIYVQEIL